MVKKNFFDGEKKINLGMKKIIWYFNVFYFFGGKQKFFIGAQKIFSIINIKVN